MTRSIPSPKLLATGGAVLAASVAYAIGAQTGGGTAGAATSPQATPAYAAVASGATGATGPAGAHRGFGRGGRDLGALLGEAATALGVSEARLRAALQELRPPRGARRDRRADLTAALARSLGVEEAKVAAALDEQAPARGRRADRTERFSALAEELGLSAAKVEAAFRAVRPERRAQRGTQGGRDAFLTALAAELGVTREKLATALGTTGGPGFGHHHRGGPGHGGLDAAALATALGVQEAEVTKALSAFRAARRQELEALKDRLVGQLATELGVSEAKVAEVAERLLPRLGRHRP